MATRSRQRDLARAVRAIDEFLEAIGVDARSDPELAETGRRVAEAWSEDLLGGYDLDAADILSEHTAATSRGLVVVTDIAAATMCPHHLLPSMGTVHVGYFPGEHVVGLGALGRVVDCYARRLSLQETLGDQIAGALVAHLGARGAGCVVDLNPTCVTLRGERRHGARAVTLAFAGSMAASSSERAELLAAIGARSRSVP